MFDTTIRPGLAILTSQHCIAQNSVEELRCFIVEKGDQGSYYTDNYEHIAASEEEEEEADPESEDKYKARSKIIQMTP